MTAMTPSTGRMKDFVNLNMERERPTLCPPSYEVWGQVTERTHKVGKDGFR